MGNHIQEEEPSATDYVLVTAAYTGKDEASTRQVVLFDPPAHVYGDIWVGRIEHSLCEAILDATEPRGLNFEASRLYTCSYAFYRLNAPFRVDNPYEFDSDNCLYSCIALSRIVHPTAADFEHAARVLKWADGTLKIIPARQTNLNPCAYVIDTNENWLIPDDLPELCKLLEVLRSGPIPRRLAASLWYHEMASRQHFVNVSWPLITTSLEALVRIANERGPSGGRAGSTMVFVKRLHAIAKKLDPPLAITEKELSDMYEQRSLLTHGLEFVALDHRRKVLYRSQERLLRGILRKAFLDPSFRDIFASDTNVRVHLPLK